MTDTEVEEDVLDRGEVEREVTKACAPSSGDPAAVSHAESRRDRLLAHDAAQRARIEALEAEREEALREAFSEGWRGGYDCGMGCASYTGYCDAPTIEEAWEESDARQALEDQ